MQSLSPLHCDYLVQESVQMAELKAFIEQKVPERSLLFEGLGLRALGL